MWRSSLIAVAAIFLSILSGAPALATEVLVSSRDTSEIYKFNLETGASTAFITGAKSGLAGPVGMRYGPDGNLYVSNFFNNEVRKYNGVTGAPLGVFIPASAGLSLPTDLRFGPDGNLYVANYGSDEIRRFNGKTGAPLAADQGKAFAAGGDLSSGTSIKFVGNTMYVTSFNTNKLLTYNITSPASAPSTTFADAAPFVGDGDFGPGGSAFYNGQWYVSGLLGQKIGVFDHLGAPVRQFAAPDFAWPSDILFTPDGKMLVASTGLSGVYALDPLTGDVISRNPANPFDLYLYNSGMSIAGQLLFQLLPGDATENAVVDIADYTVWADNFLKSTNVGHLRGDFNHDGFVDIADYTLWADNFAPFTPALAAVAVPEPSTIALSAIAGICWLLFRRRGMRSA